MGLSRALGFKTVLAPVDVGEGLYVAYPIYPRWYAWPLTLWRRLALFFGIVWRRWEDDVAWSRISAATAWEVVTGIHKWSDHGVPMGARWEELEEK